MKGQFLDSFSPDLLIFIWAWWSFCRQCCGLWRCTFFCNSIFKIWVCSDNLYWNIWEDWLIVKASNEVYIFVGNGKEYNDHWKGLMKIYEGANLIFWLESSPKETNCFVWCEFPITGFIQWLYDGVFQNQGEWETEWACLKVLSNFKFPWVKNNIIILIWEFCWSKDSLKN